MVNDGFLDFLFLRRWCAADVRDAPALPVWIPASVFRHALLNHGLEICLIFIEINEPVFVGVPLVPFGPKRFGHFIVVEQAVAVGI